MDQYLPSCALCGDVVARLQLRNWSGGDSWWCRSKHYHDSDGSYRTLQRSFVLLWSSRVWSSRQKRLYSILQRLRRRKPLRTYTEAESWTYTWLQLLHLSSGVQALQQKSWRKYVDGLCAEQYHGKTSFWNNIKFILGRVTFTAILGKTFTESDSKNSCKRNDI